MMNDREITVIEARDMIHEHDNLTMIDVRDPDSFDEDSLDDFENIPLEELSAYLPSLNLKHRILLLCEDGKKSHQAQKIIQACSVKSFVIRGGIKEWRRVINPRIRRNFYKTPVTAA